MPRLGGPHLTILAFLAALFFAVATVEPEREFAPLKAGARAQLSPPGEALNVAWLGKPFRLPAGTPVLVRAVEPDTLHVQVLAGPAKGISWWVAKDHVKPMP